MYLYNHRTVQGTMVRPPKTLPTLERITMGDIRRRISERTTKLLDGASDLVANDLIGEAVEHWQPISRRSFEGINALVRDLVGRETLSYFERFDECGLRYDARYSLFLFLADSSL